MATEIALSLWGFVFFNKLHICSEGNDVFNILNFQELELCPKIKLLGKNTEILGDASKNGRWPDFCFIYLTLCHVQLLERRIVWPCEINTGVDSERIFILKDALNCFCVEHCLRKGYIRPHCNLIWKYLHPPDFLCSFFLLFYFAFSSFLQVTGTLLG